MSYTEALATLQATFKKPAFAQALQHLRAGREISVKVEDRFEFAVFYADGTVQVEQRQAQADVQFALTSEAVRTLSAHPADNVAGFAIALAEQILQGFASVKIIGSMWRVMTDGYVKIILSGGPDFLSYLARHGLTSVDKIMSAVRSLKS